MRGRAHPSDARQRAGGRSSDSDARRRAGADPASALQRGGMDPASGPLRRLAAWIRRLQPLRRGSGGCGGSQTELRWREDAGSSGVAMRGGRIRYGALSPPSGPLSSLRRRPLSARFLTQRWRTARSDEQVAGSSKQRPDAASERPPPASGRDGGADPVSAAVPRGWARWACLWVFFFSASVNHD